MDGDESVDVIERAIIVNGNSKVCVDRMNSIETTVSCTCTCTCMCNILQVLINVNNMIAKMVCAIRNNFFIAALLSRMRRLCLRRCQIEL